MNRRSFLASISLAPLLAKLARAEPVRTARLAIYKAKVRHADESARRHLAQLLGTPVETTQQYKFEWLLQPKDGPAPYCHYNYTQVVVTTQLPSESKQDTLNRHIASIRHLLQHSQRHITQHRHTALTWTGGYDFWVDDYGANHPHTVVAHQGRALHWLEQPDAPGTWRSDIGYKPHPRL